MSTGLAAGTVSVNLPPPPAAAAATAVVELKYHTKRWLPVGWIFAALGSHFLGLRWAVGRGRDKRTLD